ncbi:hypothetical protein [Bacillus sp. SJS]|uniref:hypothetical protein n=1 Tax=Bacillus sp. SJS TaxID=1423321 RepID=UPI0004DCD691|nr:hypothetical protein [Bacillus sp. SJS]KZZ85161.1 hypothetical protein AS29_008960 [Bacillus sp. SJS]
MEISNILCTSKPEDWLNVIEDDKQRYILMALVKSGITEDKIIEMWLDEVEKQGQAFTVMNFHKITRSDLMEKFKELFTKLICGDEVYLENRKEIISQTKNLHKIITVSLATTIGAHFGLQAAIIYPVIALFLSTVSRLGFDTYCELQGYPINDQKKDNT